MAPETINVKIFYLKSFLLGTLLTMGIGMSLSGYTDLQLGYHRLAVAGLFLFGIAPILFIKLTMRLYKRKVQIQFFDSHFSVQYFKLNGMDLIKKMDFTYAQIQSVIITRATNSASGIKAFNKNTIVLELLFVDEKEENNTRSGSISEIFYKTILTKSKQAGIEGIELHPSFITSNKGLAALIALTVLNVITLLYLMIYSSKAFPYTIFISIGMYVQILAARIRQRNYFNKLKDETA